MADGVDGFRFLDAIRDISTGPSRGGIASPPEDADFFAMRGISTGPELGGMATRDDVFFTFDE
jgi:hypothetical protein